MALRDVFLIREASMHAWKNLGFSDPSFKSEMERIYGDIAYEMAIVAMAQLPRSGKPMEQFMNWLLAVAEHGMFRAGDVKKLERSHKFRESIRKAAMQIKSAGESGIDIIDQLSDSITLPAPDDYEQAETHMDLGDGWKWVEVTGEDCQSYEGQMMQHCGQAESNNMLSLRDPQGKPHVTVEITLEEIDDGLVMIEPGIAQVKGKQNAVPDKKYWPMIKKLYDSLPKNLKGFGEYSSEFDELFQFLTGERR